MSRQLPIAHAYAHSLILTKEVGIAYYGMYVGAFAPDIHHMRSAVYNFNQPELSFFRKPDLVLLVIILRVGASTRS